MICKKITYKGIDIPQCNISIGAISISPDRSSMSFIAQYFISGYDAFHTETYSCPCDLSSNESVEVQCYNYLNDISSDL